MHDPFLSPAPKGVPPYWLGESRKEIEDKRIRLRDHRAAEWREQLIYEAAYGRQ